MKTPMMTIASSMVIANQSWARSPTTARLKIIDRPRITMTWKAEGVTLSLHPMI